MLLGLALLGGGAQAATESPEEWFANEGESTLQSFAPSVFPEMSEEERAALAVGDPVPFAIVDDWSDPRGGGQESTSWIAPVLSGETIVGAISHSEGGDIEDADQVVADVLLGEQIAGMTETDVLFQDLVLGGHYIIREDEVIPASDAALDRLAGSTSVDVFIDLRRALMAEGQSMDDDAPPPDQGPIIIAVVILGIFLLSAVIVTWLRHSPHAPQLPEPVHRQTREVRFYRRGGSRVNTDD